jgi:large subunit ribosomal protein L11
MAKKVTGFIKLQVPAGAANPAPPVGPALGQHGVNIMEFCKQFNARTQSLGWPHRPGGDHRLRGPQLHLHHQDAPRGRPAEEGRRPEERLGVAEASEGRLGHEAQVRQIAETKMPDLNAADIEGAMKQIVGTARSMGIEITG